MSVSATSPGSPRARFRVQDAAAQLAAPLLDAKPGMRVLDACAAPGGKTGHLLEHTPGLAEVVAVDVEERRFGRVRENLERLGRDGDPRSRPTSAGRTGGGTASRFDRILVDAPCSSTGVIRRHPDIKILRRPTDIAALAATQRAILEACFQDAGAGRSSDLRHVLGAPGREPGGAGGLPAERIAATPEALPATLAAQVPGRRK